MNSFQKRKYDVNYFFSYSILFISGDAFIFHFYKSSRFFLIKSTIAKELFYTTKYFTIELKHCVLSIVVDWKHLHKISNKIHKPVHIHQGLRSSVFFFVLFCRKGDIFLVEPTRNILGLFSTMYIYYYVIVRFCCSDHYVTHSFMSNSCHRTES